MKLKKKDRNTTYGQSWWEKHQTYLYLLSSKVFQKNKSKALVLSPAQWNHTCLWYQLILSTGYVTKCNTNEVGNATAGRPMASKCDIYKIHYVFWKKKKRLTTKHFNESPSNSIVSNLGMKSLVFGLGERYLNWKDELISSSWNEMWRIVVSWEMKKIEVCDTPRLVHGF